MPAPVQAQQAAIRFLVHKKYVIGAGWRLDEEWSRTARTAGKLRKRVLRQCRGRVGVLALLCKNFAQSAVHAR